MPETNRGVEPLAVAAAVADKGLKPNAISFLSNLVIGVASAAPAYSLASALGTIAGIAAFGTPGVMIVAFVPMLCIATAYFYLNRADPDCGTTFAWAARSMGPHMGWIGGWALTVTNILVMPSLAVIAGQYSFQLLGLGEPSTLAVTLVGVAWIVLMTAICYSGIELSARTQQVLLGTELAILLIFAALALVHVYGANPPAASAHIAAGWFDPLTAGNLDTITEALLVAVFIYWGWDSSLSVNEETENPETAPGRAAILSTFLLLGLYVFVAASALAFAGPALLSANKADIFAPIGQTVLGAWLGKLLILAVLTSASAATQTTILPAARTALSMAAAGAIPARFGEINPRFQSPGFATLAMGAVSIVWYVGLTLVSKNVLDDSLLALGLPIAFYYALTGFACAIYYRRDIATGVRNFMLMGVIPVTGALMMVFLFIKSCFTLAHSGSSTFFGIGAPAVIGVGSLLAGLPLMMMARVNAPGFFSGEKQLE
jgi:amino acid transporter